MEFFTLFFQSYALASETPVHADYDTFRVFATKDFVRYTGTVPDFRPCFCGAGHPVLASFDSKACVCGSYLSLKSTLPDSLFTKAVGHGCARALKIGPGHAVGST